MTASSQSAVKQVRGFVFDMDGVIYAGSLALPGAADFINGLRHAHVPFIFLTNNSTTPPTRVAERLMGMGIAVSADEIVTSSEVTAAALAHEIPGARTLVVGEEGIRAALAAQGLPLVHDHREADAVVVGLDRQFTYAKLQEAGLAIRRGAAFFATNEDRTLPTPLGLVPGAGSIVAALQAATDVEPRVFGKPSPGMYLYALPRLGTPAGATAAVGDRPETDILGGQLAGLLTIAVLTGAGTRAAFEAMEPPPDWVFEDLRELGRAYLDP
jgi:4-nitrophenyl phosphatase